MEIIKTIEKFKKDENQREFSFNIPASEYLINKVENLFNIKFSKELKYFYQTLNGIEDNDEFMFRIIPLEEVIENYEKKYFEIDTFVFAEYLIYSEIWEFDFEIEPEKAKIVSYRPHIIIWSETFTEFLEIFYEKGLDGLLK